MGVDGRKLPHGFLMYKNDTTNTWTLADHESGLMVKDGFTTISDLYAYMVSDDIKTMVYNCRKLAKYKSYCKSLAKQKVLLLKQLNYTDKEISKWN